MKTRNTIQKSLIIDAVVYCDHPSADDVFNYVSRTHPSISRGTVYRNLGQMAQNGEILRIEIPNAPDRFDHNTSKHFHFRCTECNSMYDIDAPQTDVFLSVPDNGLRVTDYEVLYKGVCMKCANECKYSQ